ncbi:MULTISPECIES: DNA methyltransferase [unclassified Novosphingobium]|uniref:DNA methyltransferase n=1 Tax=unclassified Novosphingobium TaxID=2644732 RepID=UPI000D4C4064|nr:MULTISPECIES: DNA methyltransferase [unclassified Novosphingobium]PTR08286.1 site-specific DNA-methyltransferase (adenine-specific) [Novosphingobium sp. GV055]PUB01040.1 site-specific DNA-methyltransferase (adenine-specific) [Novosphingobium sp. GV061]PUB16573.1 site-specific DNA-methyltransferase (adenine-specific) [Novosphingobium sp. GV079]PUB39877.1 site-specific DNA-methyltransferase (adenine-specific) [Novosphingobium sp. GV027]
MTTIVRIGPATLYLGDAYQIRPTLGFMDADVMDPPYAFNNSGGGNFRKTREGANRIVEEGLDCGFDRSIINAEWSGAVVVFCHQDQLGDLIPEIVEDDRDEHDALIVADMFAHLRTRFRRAALCVWIKPNPSPMANKHYLADMEPYIHAWNPGFHPQGEHHDKHRWTKTGAMRTAAFNHPTVKPDPLMAKILANVAGERICDPFMGTGSTGVAALRAGKQFVGIEKNPVHFHTAVDRITATWQSIQQEAA